MSSDIEYSIMEFSGNRISQRFDGYMNATEMCKVGNKKYNDYSRLKQTKEFMDAMVSVARIPATELVHTIQGGDSQKQGTWVHPRVAMHLAQWISPKFAVQVADWVFRFMQGDLSLVKEVVDRHDKINGTESRILIESYDRQLLEHKEQIQEYKEQVQNLNITNGKLNKTTEVLQSKINGLNELTCPYCDKRYSSTNGLSNHTNNKCEEKNKKQFLAIVDADAFKIYMDLIIDDWDSLKEIYRFHIRKANWDSRFSQVIITSEIGKERRYSINRNSDRISLLMILSTQRNVPINLLVDHNAMAMFANNSDIIQMIRESREYEPGLKAVELEEALEETADE